MNWPFFGPEATWQRPFLSLVTSAVLVVVLDADAHFANLPFASRQAVFFVVELVLTVLPEVLVEVFELVDLTAVAAIAPEPIKATAAAVARSFFSIVHPFLS